MIKQVTLRSADKKKVLSTLKIEPRIRVKVDTSMMAPDEVEILQKKFMEDLGESYIAKNDSISTLETQGIIESNFEFDCIFDETNIQKNHQIIQYIFDNFKEHYGEIHYEVSKVVDYKFDAPLFENENTVAAGVILFGDKFRKVKGEYRANEWYNVCHINPKNPNYGDREEIARYFKLKNNHTKISVTEDAETTGSVNIFGNFNYLIYRVERIGEKRGYRDVRSDKVTQKSMMQFIVSTGFMLLEHDNGQLKRIIFKTNETKPLQAEDMNALTNWMMKSWVEKKFTKGNNYLFSQDMEKISDVLKRETFITSDDIDNLIIEKNRRSGKRIEPTPENLKYNPFKNMDKTEDAAPVQEQKPVEKKAKKAAAKKEEPVVANEDDKGEEPKSEPEQSIAAPEESKTEETKAAEQPQPVEEEVVQ